MTAQDPAAAPAAGPVPVMVRLFRCPYCGHQRAKKDAVADHIARCWHTPANRTCRTCRNFIPGVPVGW